MAASPPFELAFGSEGVGRVIYSLRKEGGKYIHHHSTGVQMHFTHSFTPFLSNGSPYAYDILLHRLAASYGETSVILAMWGVVILFFFARLISWS